jgi:hypothetical protein
MNQPLVKAPLPPAWICTDGDTSQYGRKLAPGVYEFKEDREHQPGHNKTVRATVVLANHSQEETESVVSAYYDSVAALRAEYAASGEDGEDADWIIAECLFESIY